MGRPYDNDESEPQFTLAEFKRWLASQGLPEESVREVRETEDEFHERFRERIRKRRKKNAD